mmetsp:Transcript_7918/g.28171  ORF Transcript_7918/g.28171 Transcript_7918/m.28171 type:complete len:498 (-) Transcript_7918:229-1722(-)
MQSLRTPGTRPSEQRKVGARAFMRTHHPVRAFGSTRTRRRDAVTLAGNKHVDVDVVERKKLLVVGAGPAGLLFAHLVLANPKQSYEVRVVDARPDPRLQSQETVRRQYSLGLGIRGRTAIRNVPGLWEEVKQKGVPCDKFLLHFGKRAVQLRQNALPGTEASLMINRDELCLALLEGLMSRHGNSGKLTISYNTKCEEVNVEMHEVALNSAEEGEHNYTYDLLVGADGVNSRVRDALETSTGLAVEKKFLPNNWKVIYQKFPGNMDPLAVHAIQAPKAKNVEGSEPFGMFFIPSPGNNACILINWNKNHPPLDLLSLQTGKEVAEVINSRVEAVEGGILADACENFVLTRPSSSLTIKCNQYHNTMAKVLLLGDAAHSSGGASGQGANSSLQDAVILEQLLASTGEDLDATLEEYSRRQVKEGHALLDLSVYNQPRTVWVRTLWLLQNARRAIFSKLLPSIVQPPIPNLLTQTLTPFSEIRDKNSFWIDLVKKDMQE